MKKHILQLKFKIFYFPLLLIILLFINCKKKVEEANPEFIGFWVGIEESPYHCRHEFNIDAQSFGKWKVSGTSDCHGDGSGIVKVSKDNRKLRLGSLRIKIIEPPTMLASPFYYGPSSLYVNWRMTLQYSIFYNSLSITYYR